MLTLAFAQIVWAAVFQWEELTGGSNGVIGVWPPPPFDRSWVYFLLTLVLAVAAVLLLRRFLFAPPYLLKLIDGMRIAPRTPGVYMNVYYSQENLQGARPTTRDSWDYMLWTPVSQQSFVLRKNQLIQFPTPIRAAFMKLEFTNLNPLPWRVPIYPPLPPKLFYRFPTW